MRGLSFAGFQPTLLDDRPLYCHDFAHLNVAVCLLEPVESAATANTYSPPVAAHRDCLAPRITNTALHFFAGATNQ
jgi:hypothetical protein